MAEQKKDFFISRTGADAKWAQWIGAVLEENGYTVILQDWDFRLGSNIVSNMHKALRESCRMILVISSDYLQSGYCEEEWTNAIAQSKLSGEYEIVPIRVEDVSPDGMLTARNYISLFQFVGEEKEKDAEAFLLEQIKQEIPRVRPAVYPGAVQKTQARAAFPGAMPTHNLPYGRNPHFTGRDDTLRTIHQNFEAGDTVAITQSIAGLGGIGKTQTAMEYAYRYAAHYKTIWWVAAETPQTTQESFLKFVRKMQLLPPDIMEESIITGAVQNWLSQNEGWLFIYDNATGGKQLEPYLPHTATGHVLITTRDTTMNVSQSVSLDVFSPEDALDFLAKRTGIPGDKDNAALLAERLGHLPLALEQAAAYIYENHICYADYLKMIYKYGLRMLEEESTITNYGKTVSVTWLISMKELKKSTKYLLYWYSCFAPNNIDVAWFSKNADLLPLAILKTCTDERRLNQALTELARYSLIRREGTKVSIHRLLLEVLREEWQAEHTLLSLLWLYRCYHLVKRIYTYKYGNIESRKQFILLLPHALTIAERAERFLRSFRSQVYISDIYEVTGNGYSGMGLYDAALEWHQRALVLREKILGKENLATAATYEHIAQIARIKGKYDEALELYQKTLRIRKKKLGERHPDTMISYDGIATVYGSQDRCSEALEWHQKALVIGEDVLGKEHLGTAAIYHNIAATYERQSKYAEALAWYRKALDIEESKEHPHAASSYSSIAGVCVHEEKYDEALIWNRKALDIREKMLGSKHPDTAESYAGIAEVYYNQGDYDKALDLYQKALRVFKIAFDEESPQVAALYCSIANVFSNQGEYEKSLEWYRKALNIREKVLGKEHSDTAVTYNNIAKAYDRQGDGKKALEWYRKALDVREKVLGREHQLTATTHRNISYVYEQQGDFCNALSWMQKAYPIFKKVFGDEHTKTRYSLEALEDFYTKCNLPTPFQTWLTETFPEEEPQNLE